MNPTMTQAKTKAGARVRMASRLLAASYHGIKHRALFDGVQVYCMFIGYPRSGHSLVGALLDAHPNIVIAHEMDALRYVQSGHMTRDRLFWLILERDRVSVQGRRTKRYDYSVPDQWQGRFTELRAIGDKMGGESSLRLGRHPELLSRLAETVRTELRIVHVVRNPFDNIATMHIRKYGTLEECRDKYFSMCGTNDRIRRRGDVAVMDVRHEALIDDPTGCLTNLCGFLRVEASSEYLADCAAIVNPSPHRSRTEVQWSADLIVDVQHRIETFDFLTGYTFDT